jgi:hypothetical protein
VLANDVGDGLRILQRRSGPDWEIVGVVSYTESFIELIRR